MPVSLAVALSLSFAHHTAVTPACAKLAPILVPCSSATLSRCTGPCMGIGRAFGGRSPSGDKKKQAQKSPPGSAELTTPQAELIAPPTDDEVFLARLSAVRYPGSRNALAAVRSAYARNNHHRLADQLKLMEFKTELHRDAGTGQFTFPGWRGDVGMSLLTERWLFKDVGFKDVDSGWANEKSYFQRAQALHEKMPERLPWSIWVSARSYLYYAIALCLFKPAMSFIDFLDGIPEWWLE